MRWPRFTVRRMIVLIALAGVGLGVVASERWRWGYPRRIWFDETTAIRRLATVIRSDRRMYNSGDLRALGNLIIAKRMFIGMTGDQILDRLHLADRADDRIFIQRDPGSLTVIIGVDTVGVLDGAEWIVCYFDGAGRCTKVIWENCC